MSKDSKYNKLVWWLLGIFTVIAGYLIGLTVADVKADIVKVNHRVDTVEECKTNKYDIESRLNNIEIGIKDINMKFDKYVIEPKMK